eukprot:scaffold549_cov385-Prasinococcus_capsulatus_cf.AAC.30
MTTAATRYQEKSTGRNMLFSIASMSCTRRRGPRTDSSVPPMRRPWRQPSTQLVPNASVGPRARRSPRGCHILCRLSR